MNYNIIKDIIDINNTFFVIGGQGVSVLEFVSVLCGLICVFLAGRNNKHNFWFGYLYNILLFLLFAQRHLYSVMLLQPISLAITALGQWRWSNPHKGEESVKDKNSLKVTSISKNAGTMLISTVLICTILWGYILSNLGVTWLPHIFQADPRPYLDSFLLMLTLSALYLSAQKKWECWIIWLLVNIFNIVLYISAGLIFMPIVSFLYLLNGVWSLYTWYKLYKKGI